MMKKYKATESLSQERTVNKEGKGMIKVGMDADIVVLDADYSVIQTYCMGEAKL